MTKTHHLTEAQRQEAADGSLDAGQLSEVNGHLAVCMDCARDVMRMRELMRRVHAALMPSADLVALWPAIRSRIEQSKLVSLDGPPAAVRASGRGYRWWLSAGCVAAAATIVVSATVRVRQRTGPVAIQRSDSDTFTNVADSSRAYEEEAAILLNELEMQRSMMRPSTAASVDHDLQIIDKSIAELKAAMVRDPNDPSLRRLLASSYRQKVELLKRAGNAG